MNEKKYKNKEEVLQDLNIALQKLDKEVSNVQNGAFDGIKLEKVLKLNKIYIKFLEGEK